MDRLAEQYRFWVTDATEITDGMRVDAAQSGDQDEAAYILRECCQRLPNQANHPVVRLLAELSQEENSLKEFQKTKLVKDILRNDDFKKFLAKNKSKLGDDFYKHLITCFERSVNEYLRPRRPHNTKRRRAKWLAIGFYLAWAKKDAKGQSELQERNADATQSIHIIINAYINGSLLNGVERSVAGDRQVLPKSIERVIKLMGHKDGGPYIDESRKRVSNACIRIINKIEKKEDHRPRKIAARIYNECVKANEAHLFKIIKDLEASNRSGCNDDEISRVKEYVKVLASYGANERGKGNKGTGPEGLESVYSRNRSKLPALDRTWDNPKTKEQLEAEYWLLLEMPIIGEAVRLIDAINSPDDCDEVFLQLNVLRGKTPTGTDHMWRELVARFNAAENAVEERRDEPQSQA